MKKIGTITLIFLLVAFTNDIEAQKRKAKVVKGKNAKAVVVRKGNRANARAYRINRKRARRTRVVHYHYRNMPRRGAIVNTIHAKALTINFRGVGFRFHTGVWYKPHRSQWIVTRPTVGIRIRVLPTGYRRIVMGPNTYYYYYGTYYAKVEEEYEVIDTPLGAEVDSLPEGYTTVTKDGEEFYELDGVYYMPSVNEKGEEVLVAMESSI